MPESCLDILLFPLSSIFWFSFIYSAPLHKTFWFLLILTPFSNSKANISGTINSTDGSIGGWNIKNSSIYVKSTDGLKQTSLNSDSQKIEFKLTRPASAESDESSSFLNISNSNLSPYIELGWMTTAFEEIAIESSEI